jgi:hypothetical protein
MSVSQSRPRFSGQGKSATASHQHRVEIVGELAVSSATVSIDDKSQNFGGRASNQLIDARILKILDADPVASVG